jgi:hypothetical protein
VALDRCEELVEPSLVMGGDVVHSLGQALKAPLVSGKHLVHVKVPHLGQGVEVVAQRALRASRPQGDVRRDPGQDVVAGEQPPRALIDKAEVTRRVPGSVDRP